MAEPIGKASKSRRAKAIAMALTTATTGMPSRIGCVRAKRMTRIGASQAASGSSACTVLKGNKAKPTASHSYDSLSEGRSRAFDDRAGGTDRGAAAATTGRVIVV